MIFAPREFRTNLRCTSCRAPLRAHRTCLAVVLRCGSCGATFELREFATTLDDLLEEYLANIPCDRL